MARNQRVGIYSGTFNPVHAGHIAFALQAMKTAKLDRLYFLPERRPRHKRHVEHFGHRVAMLARATKPYNKFSVLELNDVSFSVNRTLPKLQAMFGDSELVFLVGSDTALHMAEWQNIGGLFATSEVIIGVRDGNDKLSLQQAIQNWPIQPLKTHVIDSYAADVSSHAVRQALRQRQPVKGLLASVARYSDHHWLYVSLA